MTRPDYIEGTFPRSGRAGTTAAGARGASDNAHRRAACGSNTPAQGEATALLINDERIITGPGVRRVLQRAAFASAESQEVNGEGTDTSYATRLAGQNASRVSTG
jgi:hypothetical protein